MPAELLKYLTPSGWIVALILVYLFMKYPESFEKWYNFFNKLLARYSSNAEKRYIAHDIQARVNACVSSINKEAEEIMPLKIRIRFISPDENLKDILLKKDVAIVKMESHLRQEENVAKAVDDFVGYTLVRESRPCLYQHILQAMTLRVVQNVLSKAKLYEALSWHDKNIGRSILNHETDTKEAKSTMDLIDSIGYFTRIFLRELFYVGKKTTSIVNPQLLDAFRKETSELLVFLTELAEREKGEERPELLFTKTNINFAIILVSKQKTARLGVEPYLARFRRQLRDEDCDRIYVVSSTPHLPFARKVVSKIKSRFAQNTEKIGDYVFPGVSRAGNPVIMMITVFQSKLVV